MSDLLFIDSAWPVIPPPPSDGVAGYIGGDTPHPWTLSDWASQPARFRLPIFTRSNPPGPGAAADVAEAVAALEYIGAPTGTLVAWDSETSQDPSYMQQVYHHLRAAGWVLIDYGSQSSVFGNQNPDGYIWGAEWTGQPFIAPGDAMTQYRSLAAWDDSLASPLLPFWDTHPPHHHAPRFLGDAMIQLDPALAPHTLVFSGAAKKIRFACHTAASVRVEFPGQQATVTRTLGFAAGAQDIDVAGASSAVVHVDSGTDLIGYTEVP